MTATEDRTPQPSPSPSTRSTMPRWLPMMPPPTDEDTGLVTITVLANDTDVDGDSLSVTAVFGQQTELGLHPSRTGPWTTRLIPTSTAPTPSPTPSMTATEDRTPQPSPSPSTRSTMPRWLPMMPPPTERRHRPGHHHRARQRHGCRTGTRLSVTSVFGHQRLGHHPSRTGPWTTRLIPTSTAPTPSPTPSHDGNGGSDTATVTVTVNPVNDAPVAADDAACDRRRHGPGHHHRPRQRHGCRTGIA